ncbi:MAG: hypothetical protein Q8O40_05885 [Chloroflexota bacterium]|nr:hypothetical protein [Chloroflexota bacterium]
MPRIRSIKPEFWTDEKVGQLSLLGRLLFIGLWNLADDAGILEDSALQLKAQLFPYDSISPEDIEHQVCRLAELGLVLRYVSGNKQLLFIRHFADHQSPQHGTYKYRDYPPPGFTFDGAKRRFIPSAPLTDASVSPHRVFNEHSHTDKEREEEGRGEGVPPSLRSGGFRAGAEPPREKPATRDEAAEGANLKDPGEAAAREDPTPARASGKTTAPKRAKTGGNPVVDAVLAEIRQLWGQPLASYGREARSVLEVLELAYTPDQIIACWRAARGSVRWGTRWYPMRLLKEDIGEFVNNGGAPLRMWSWDPGRSRGATREEPVRDAEAVKQAWEEAKRG